MKKILCLLFAGVCGFLSVSCQSMSGGPESASKSWSKDGVHVLVKVEDRQFRADEDIILDLYLKNETGDALRVSEANVMKDYVWSVTNAETGKEVSLTKHGDVLKNMSYYFSSKYIVMPDEIYHYEMKLNNYFILSRPAKYHLSVEGTYYDETTKKYITYKLREITFEVTRAPKNAEAVVGEKEPASNPEAAGISGTVVLTEEKVPGSGDTVTESEIIIEKENAPDSVPKTEAPAGGEAEKK